MDVFTVIGIVVWIWGAYKGWGMISTKDLEWLNGKELLNYVVKGAVCVLLGAVFVVIQCAKIAWKLFKIMF